MKTLTALLLSLSLFVLLFGCFEPVDVGSQEPASSPGSGGGGGGDTLGTGGGTGGGSPGTCSSVTLLNPGNSVQPSTTGSCICTRRDLVPVGTCPRGVGQSTSATIGPEGGTVTLMGQQGIASGVPFTITFPPTAISTPTLITITETSLPPPAGSVDYSPVYRIDPVDLVLSEPAAVKVPWSQGMIWGAPTLFWTATSLCTLQRLPSSYSNAGFNNANVIRLGYAWSGYAEVGQAVACQ